MPPLGSNGRPFHPKPRRRKPRPYTLPSGPRGDAPQTRARDFRRANRYKRTSSYRRAVRQTRAEQRPHPSGVFAEPVGGAPLGRQRRAAARRARRAQDRLPANPRLPHIPDVRNGQGQRVITPQAAARLRRAVYAEARKAGGIRRLWDASPKEDRAKLLLFGMLERGRAARLSRGRAPQTPLRPGPAPTRIGVGPATINATALTRALIGQTAFKYGATSPELKFAAHALGDVKSLGEAPFVAGYELGASAWEAARHGDLSRAKRLAKGVAEGLRHSVPGELVTGHLGKAGEAFVQHPVFGVLDTAGAVGAVGRTAGAVARGVGSQAAKGGVRGALARAGSTVRAPIAMVDDVRAVREGRGLVEREFSKNLIRKGAQAEADRERARLHGFVTDEHGKPVLVEQRGRKVPVLRASTAERERHARRAADFDAARTNARERRERDVAAGEFALHGPVGAAGRRAEERVASAVHAEFNRAVVEHGIKGARGRDLVAMVVEGTITTAKHFEADLRARHAQVKAFLEEDARRRAAGEAPLYRTKKEIRAARRTLNVIEAALSDRRVLANKAKIVKAGEAIGRRLTGVEKAELQRLGLVTPVRAERARRVPVMSTHMGGRFFTPEELRQVGHVPPSKGQMSLLPEDVLLTEQELRHGGIRKASGEFLANREVDAFLKGRGRDPESIAYLPHRLDVRGRRAYHAQFRLGNRGSMEKGEVRTGHAYERGVTESSAKLIVEQGVRQRTQIVKAEQLDKSVHDHGVVRPDGRYFTAREALETAQRLLEDSDGAERWTPVRAFAAKLSPEAQKLIRDETQGPAGIESLSQHLLNDRIVHAPDMPGAPRARNVVLMPSEYVERLQKHLAPAGEIEKFLQMLNRPFRFAVLAQPRWLVGNFAEPFIVRLSTAGAGVNVFGLGLDIAASRKMLRQMRRSGDPRLRAAARELEAQQTGSGLFGGGRGASVRRTGEEFRRFDRVYAKMVEKLPVAAQAVDLVRLAGRALMAPGGVYFRVNRAIETAAQHAALGRDVRRDLQQFTGSWTATLRLQSKALDEVARGLVNTSAQRRFMHSQYELLGKYAGYSPWMRRLVQTAFPFIPWALNAARFVYWTMPAHRTIQTALLVKVNDVVAQDWQEVHKGTPPGGLRLAVPTKRGGWIDLARYTPYGLTGPVVEGDLEPILGQALPVAQGPYEALGGRDPFGRELQMSDHQKASALDRILAAANQAGEAVVPYVAQARRLREGGGTPFSDSTLLSPRVKPGTDYMSGARRTFDPFRPTYLHAPTSGKAGASSSPRRAPAGDDIDSQIERALQGIDAAAAKSDPLDAEVQRALENLP